MGRLEFDALTAEQEALFPRFRKQWTAVGLSTEPADRERAERALALSYRSSADAGVRRAPDTVVWVGSPRAGFALAGLLGALKRQMTDPLLTPAPLAAEIWAHVGAPLWISQIPPELSPAISAHFGTPWWYRRLTDELYDPIQDQVERCWQPAGFLMVRSLFSEAMWEEVGAPAWEALGEALAGTVAKAGSATWSRLGGELWESVVEMIRQEAEQDPREWASHDFYKKIMGTQEDAPWMAMYAYLAEIGLKQIIRRVEGAIELAQSAARCWSFEHMVIASDRPCLIRLEEKPSVKGELSGRKVRRLHAESGPAISFPDGTAVYAWRGTLVPADVITNPASITLARIQSEHDRPVRRALIERYGKDRYEQDSRLHQTSAPKITVDPGVFAQTEAGFSAEEVRVTAAEDPEAAATALERARVRLMAVTEHGTEVGWDDEGVEEPAGEPPYTPNSVSEVRRSSKGPWIDIDCKSEIPPPMRDAFIRIIVEELTEAGVKAAKLESPPLEELWSDQPHPS